jgi:hypothetical protein
MPHYFIISKNSQLNYFFSPNSLYPEITDKYLETIKPFIINNH